MLNWVFVFSDKIKYFKYFYDCLIYFVFIQIVLFKIMKMKVLIELERKRQKERNKFNNMKFYFCWICYL